MENDDTVILTDEERKKILDIDDDITETEFEAGKENEDK